MPQILLIDDEPAITESLAYAVRKAGLDAVCAGSLSEGNAALEAHEIALIVLDIMLPDGNGLDWFRDFRTRQATPVIVLSSHDETIDRIVGLELGADDYVVKPFSPREVTARIKAVLRRSRGPQDDTIPSARLRVDSDRRRAWAHDNELTVSRIEFELLRLFVEHPGRVFERDHILNRVWGPDVAVTERTIDVHIKSLRKKIVQAGLDADTIETVRGVGYRLAEDV